MCIRDSDSDVVLPEGYLKAVSDELSREPADAFGGPDKAPSSFTDTQKAISYSMTSSFTTGGIRGGKKKMDKFYPDVYKRQPRLPFSSTVFALQRRRLRERIRTNRPVFSSIRCV